MTTHPDADLAAELNAIGETLGEALDEIVSDAISTTYDRLGQEATDILGRALENELSSIDITRAIHATIAGLSAQPPPTSDINMLNVKSEFEVIIQTLKENLDDLFVCAHDSAAFRLNRESGEALRDALLSVRMPILSILSAAFNVALTDLHHLKQPHDPTNMSSM